MRIAFQNFMTKRLYQKAERSIVTVKIKMRAEALASAIVKINLLCQHLNDFVSVNA